MKNISLEEIKKKHKYYNNSFFAKWASLYDYEKYLLTPLRIKAAKFIDLRSPKRILDVATGTGAQAYELAKQGHEVVGIDLSPEMLKQAQKKRSPKLKLSFRHADGTELPFKDNEFDVATISFGLHDMPREVDIKVLKEMERVTKKNGKILIVDYNEPRNHWAAKIIFPLINIYETKNWRPFIERGLKNLLKQVGLKTDSKTDFFGIAQIVVAKNNKKL